MKVYVSAQTTRVRCSAYAHGVDVAYPLDWIPGAYQHNARDGERVRDVLLAALDQ